ncbi:RNA ligase [Prosthecobacter fusiformis]|uniref:RNA ligase n=1 Tax=Prosthecobacter fusiformis TaxID=48464 RepID=A0A4R7SSR0_9BACT|nr:RNA ligase family protein [Prosthecobacter fusiformis]TDU81526.1 RNA ligase [Prosthecobacter fusiformis]
MGASHDSFIKYPRTPHLFGSKGTEDDRHLGAKASAAFIANPSLIVEEKLDGTNVGIHFTTQGRMVLQCRGHEITEGMHPQYDLFKQWTAYKRPVLEQMLSSRYILFGEWLYARHSVAYLSLPHYFFEFDIYDKEESCFLSLARRLEMLEGTGVHTVPVVHQGAAKPEVLLEMIQESAFEAVFDNPLTGRPDARMEGLYLRIEAEGKAIGRAKIVRPEFVEKVKQSEHWQHQKMVPNELAEGADIWL